MLLLGNYNDQLIKKSDIKNDNHNYHFFILIIFTTKINLSSYKTLHLIF